jgi:succinate dehydrogenase / fumarate reductase cytochrome b subunit
MIVAAENYARLRRLHSLSGLLPLGAFLIGHIAVNATALAGADAYNRAAAALERLPLVRMAEILLIAVPMVFHVVLGALLGNTEPALRETRPHLGDRARAAQRASGALLVAYVLFHVWSTRLAPDFPGGRGDLFAFMAEHLKGGIMYFYSFGVVAACVHFGIGLYDFAHRWGLVQSAAAARRWARGAAIAAFAIATAGLATLSVLG